MARIFLLDVTDPDAASSESGFLLDAEGWDKASFLPLPIAARVMLNQQAPILAGFPAGSLGSMVTASVNANLGEWYHILNFNHDAGDLVEYGAIIADVELTWGLDFPIEEVISYELVGPGAAGVEIFDYNLAVTLIGVNVGSNSTWVLTCQNSFGVIEASCTLEFGFKVFFGRGGATVLTEAQIEALASNVLATEQQLNYNFLANAAGVGAEYLWLAWPEEFGGIPTFLDTATSLKVPFTDLGLVVVTNSLGVVRNYRLARSVSGVNGAINLVTADVIVEGEATVAYVEAAVAAKQDKVLSAGWAGVGSAVTPLIGGTVSASIPFTPFQVIWLLELACSAAGPATVTLTGTRRDNVTLETVAVYNLSAGQTIYEANDRTDYVKFVWTSTGLGVVSARII